MKQYTMIMVILALVLSLGTGCQKSDASQIRKARLIGAENLKLKKQIEEKDQQIAELKKDIERIEAESAKKQEQAGETSIKSMRLLMESEKRAEGLLIENRKLKEELEKLKAE